MVSADLPMHVSSALSINSPLSSPITPSLSLQAQNLPIPQILPSRTDTPGCSPFFEHIRFFGSVNLP